MQIIEKLIFLFSKLPGLGRRSARRIVLYLLQDKDTRLKSLIEILVAVSTKVNHCNICGNIDIKLPCYICQSNTRDNSVIAIVETVADLWAIERSGSFNGRYHVLNNSSSCLESPLEIAGLKLENLEDRCKVNNIKEIIIATNSTMSGQMITHLIFEFFKSFNIKISKLANGIPIGGELDYLDEGTLSTAISTRHIFS